MEKNHPKADDALTVPYDRQKAVSYAHRWAYSRNPAYYDFDPVGGDCTNFISQCLFAGSGVMNDHPVKGWYYRDGNSKSPSWTGVKFLYRFLTSNRERGPMARVSSAAEMMFGDVVQLAFQDGDFRHSLFVVAAPSDPTIDNILVAAHTFDSDWRPLNSYSVSSMRFLHILGVGK